MDKLRLVGTRYWDKRGQSNKWYGSSSIPKWLWWGVHISGM